MKYGGFDIRKPETARLMTDWATGAGDATKEQASEAAVADAKRVGALDLFQQGLELYRQGDVTAALARWKEGVALEPDNLVIRKQVWAVEHPERFYATDKVDYAWQREQFEKGL